MVSVGSASETRKKRSQRPRRDGPALKRRSLLPRRSQVSPCGKHRKGGEIFFRAKPFISATINRLDSCMAPWGGGGGGGEFFLASVTVVLFWKIVRIGIACQRLPWRRRWRKNREERNGIGGRRVNGDDGDAKRRRRRRAPLPPPLPPPPPPLILRRRLSAARRRQRQDSRT